ncbi:MAG: hypothetical protein JJ964_10395 [Rhizobiales bacterium]|nr:hypothetical protein [Hyphomicrobiales bacterium]
MTFDKERERKRLEQTIECAEGRLKNLIERIYVSEEAAKQIDEARTKEGTIVIAHRLEFDATLFGALKDDPRAQGNIDAAKEQAEIIDACNKELDALDEKEAEIERLNREARERMALERDRAYRADYR